MRRIERIEYRRGLLEAGTKANDLPIRAWQDSEIPEAVRRAIREEGIPDLSGVFGDREAGDPASTTS